MRAHVGGSLRQSSSNLSDTGKLIGRVFDNRYQIVELIGRGGMSAVYKAIQLSMGKTVAIKVMARSLAEDERLLQRFNQEALASSRLRHPNTIKVFDYGQSDDGHLFLAMELLEGRTLGQVIRTDAPMDPLRTCKIARQVCKSLAEAHRAGIVHRDLKPDNVFLSDIYGERDFVKVLDFGIAKFVTEGTQETLTQTGFICGTPLYLSPEQGLAKNLDHRTDLYSLGIILYEMLVGVTPFRADTPIGVVMKHIHEPVLPFRTMDPSVNVPGGLEHLVMRLLEKDPGRRPGSSEEVGATIEDLLSSPEMPRMRRGGPPRPPPRREADDPGDMTLMAAPQRVAGRVVSMHLNARPTMYLPADQLPDPSMLQEEGERSEGARTEAIPERWSGPPAPPPAACQDDDWDERTMLLSADGLAQHDPDRTEFLPVPSDVSSMEEETRVFTRDELRQDATTSGVPEAASGTGRSWLWAAAAVVLLGGGASIYFLTDWLHPSPGASAATELAELAASVAGDSRAGAASLPAAPPQGLAAEPRQAGPGGAKAEAPPSAPAPGGDGASQPAQPAPAEAAEMASVLIATQPEGAEVLDGSEVIGTTPFELPVPGQGEARNLVVRLDGHKDEVLLVDPAVVPSGGRIEVKLTAVVPAVDPPAPDTAGAKAEAVPEKGAASDGSKSAGRGPKTIKGETPKKPPAQKGTKGTASEGKKPSGKSKGGDMEWKDW
ncbi:MAG: hypothetical protein AMXMBFR64_31650 [Myxococcales bacterium]